MSLFNTKQALLSKLLTTSITGVTEADIFYENDNSDPSNKPLWVEYSFIPATSDMMGKTTSDRDEERGIFQVTVAVQLNSGEQDNAQLKAIDEIKAGFSYNSLAVYNGQNVSILDSSSNSGRIDESWFKRDISINYLTFSNRG